MAKSPSPDSGIESRERTDSDNDAPTTRTRSGKRLRRISSHSSLEDDSPLLPRRAGKRARARISDSSDAMEPDDDAKRSGGESSDEEVGARGRRDGKRRRVEDDSDWEEEKLTKAKSSKDQLRKLRKAHDRNRRMQGSPEADGGGDVEVVEDDETDGIYVYEIDNDDDRPHRRRAFNNSERPTKFVRPSRAELKMRAFEFFNTALEEEMTRVKGISKRSYAIIAEMRPFQSYEDMLEEKKGVSSGLIKAYLEMLDAESELERILADCSRESFELSQAVAYLEKESGGEEEVAPSLLTNRDMKLKPYQVIGVRWLHLMNGQRLNAILADEMGLGKTVQVVAFLALLKERQKAGTPNPLHLIVVPSSTIDNWFTELHKWWPEVGVLNYYGGTEDRSFIRQDVMRRIRKFNRGKPADNDDMEDDDRPLDVLLTTYSMITSKAEDRAFLKKITISYAVFDEAHMLKNCKTKRYKELTRIRAQRKILLTGTPLQNNLLELMSLMAFVMPSLFKGEETTNDIFDMFTSREGTKYAAQKIKQAKELLAPFMLRRLKAQVLTELPDKEEEVIRCEMTEYQKQVYEDRVEAYRKDTEAVKEGESAKAKVGVIMQLRKASQHPLLHRFHYDDGKLTEMAGILCREEPALANSEPSLVAEDMSVMSDVEIHKEICLFYKSMDKYKLPKQHLFESGKLVELDRLLPEFKADGKKVLLFSQFVIVLDYLEDYLKARNLSFLRLDGSTPVVERQSLIDDFNNEPEISIFLLSTRAGGLGINLTSASIIILHDIDYNPYNDRQAEDRAHRLGQSSTVRVIKLVSSNTIEERILEMATSKLHLERQVTGDLESEKESRTKTMESMLKAALRL